MFLGCNKFKKNLVSTKLSTRNKKACKYWVYRLFCGVAGNRTRVQTSN